MDVALRIDLCYDNAAVDVDVVVKMILHSETAGNVEVGGMDAEPFRVQQLQIIPAGLVVIASVCSGFALQRFVGENISGRNARSVHRAVALARRGKRRKNIVVLDKVGIGRRRVIRYADAGGIDRFAGKGRVVFIPVSDHRFCHVDVGGGTCQYPKKANNDTQEALAHFIIPFSQF